MSLLDELATLGVNVSEAVGRFMGNAALYERMLGKLPAAIAGSPVLPCFEAEDLEAALRNAHALKGVTGNLSVQPLYEGYSQIVSCLRNDQPVQAREALDQLLPIQEQIVACIERWKAN